MAIDLPPIDPVAFAVGPLEVRWYALAYLAGFILGWRYGVHMARRSPNNRPNEDDIDDFIPWAVLGVILGGRLGYVLFYQWAYYSENLSEAYKIWHGGMSFHGGVIGIIAALLIFAALRKIAVLRLSDIVCTVAPIGIFFGRIANFINGELFGRATDVPWAIVFPYGGDIPRHPSQLYEAALEGLLLAVVMFVLSRQEAVRKHPGILTGVFLAGYGIARLVVEQFREPDAHLGLVLGPLSMGQILSAPMALFGLAVIGFAFWAGRPKTA